MCLVSGSLQRILKFLRMTFLIARFYKPQQPTIPLFEGLTLETLAF